MIEPATETDKKYYHLITRMLIIPQPLQKAKECQLQFQQRQTHVQQHCKKHRQSASNRVNAVNRGRTLEGKNRNHCSDSEATNSLVLLSLGLDISTHTGFSFVIDGNLSFCGIIDISKIKSIEERFLFFFNAIVNLIEKNKPNLVIIEDCHFATNQKTFKLLSQLQGIAILACASSGVPFQLISPTAARKIVLNNGKLKKQEIYERLQTMFPLMSFFDEGYNQSDALLLSLVPHFEKKEAEDETG